MLRRLSITTLLLVAFFALLALPTIAAALPHSPAESAWFAARERGSYRFAAEITQHSLPQASVRSLGQQARTERLRLEGQTDLRARAMHLRLWAGNGSAASTPDGVEVRITDDRAEARQGDGAWQPIENFSAALAPGGDFLAFLSAASELTPLEDTTVDGRTLRRYGFTIDGPRFAEAMAQRSAELLIARGELLPGTKLAPSPTFAELRGSGELWLSPDGLPARQTLDLTFPPQAGEQSRAVVSIDFFDFAAAPTSLLAPLSAASRELLPFSASLGFGGLICGVLIRFRHSRWLARTLSVTLITLIIFSPLFTTLPAVATAAARAERQAEDAARTAPSEMQRTLADARQVAAAGQNAAATLAHVRADNGQDADRDGLSDLQETLLGLDPIQTTNAEVIREAGLAAPVAVLQSNPSQDSDGDTLTDAEEVLLGTSSDTSDADLNLVPDGQDTDGDGVTDDREVTTVVTIAGQPRSTDPLKIDSNDDGLDDGREWGRDTDSDSVADVFDLDNDGDAVPDKQDLSPFERGTQVYSRANPLAITVNNAQPGSVSYVELQLRPTNPQRLWYAFSVFDWPGNDSQGQVQDVDNLTFRDVAGAGGRANDADGDVRLVPMLEVELPNNPSQLALAPPRAQMTLREATVGADTRAFFNANFPTDNNPISGDVTLTNQGSDLRLQFSVANPQRRFAALVRGNCAQPGTRATEARPVANDGSVIFGSRSLQAVANGQFAVVIWKAGSSLAPDYGSWYACAAIPALTFDGTRMVDADFYNTYGISVRPQGTGNVAYVPLNLVNDPRTGEQVAFSAKMVYRVQSTLWGQAHRYRVVWMVQALVDLGCRPAANGTFICDTRNQAQLIHAYDETWTLAGLNIREDRGSQIAYIYEDHTVDSNPRRDDTLLTFAASLDRTFLAGRDCDVQDANGRCIGDGQRDITVNTLRERFDRTVNGSVPATQRWGIDNTLRVNVRNYEHVDAAIFGAAQGDTRTYALNAFPTTGAYTPTLLMAREDRFRALNLDVQNSADHFTWADSERSLTVNFMTNNPVRQQTVASVNVAPFRYNTALGRWEAAPIEGYWKELRQRHANDFDDQVATGKITRQIADGKLTFVQFYYFSLYNGLNRLVQIGDKPLTSLGSLPDAPMGATIAKGVGKAVVFIVDALFILPFALYAGSDDFLRLLADFGKNLILYNTISNGLSTAVRFFTTAAAWKIALVSLAIAAVVFIVVATVTTLLVTGIMGYGQGNAQAKQGFDITLNIVITAVTLAVSVVKPLISAISAVKELIALGLTVGDAIFDVATSAASVVGYSLAGQIVSLVIQIGIIWGVVIYQFASGTVDPNSIQGSLAIAGAISSTIVAVLFFVLSLTVAGLILAGLIGVMDGILQIICRAGVDGACWSVSGTLSQLITLFIYDAQPLIRTDDRLVQVAGMSIDLDNPAIGFQDGNSARVRLTIDVRAEQDPTLGTSGSVLYHADRFMTLKNLTDSAFFFELYPDATGKAPIFDRGSQANRWNVIGERTTTYRLGGQLGTVDRTVTLRTAVSRRIARSVAPIPLRTGINQPLPAHLSTSYTIPAVECWGPGRLSSCKDQTIKGAATGGDMGVFVDVFPATLDALVAWRWGAGMNGPRDADFDGLSDQIESRLGLDPNARDSDSDGLNDAFEIERRERGVLLNARSADTDSDGLNDIDEIRFESDPARSDTDGDGLSDLAETRGWAFTYATGKTQRVVSNPTLVDSDGDGMLDSTERALHELDPLRFPFSPQVANVGPVGLTLEIGDADRFVAPGATLPVTATLRNASPATTPLRATGTMTLSVAATLGGGLFNQNYNLLREQESVLRRNLTMPYPGTTQVGQIAAAANGPLTSYGLGAGWAWRNRAATSTNAANHPWATALAIAPGWSDPFLLVSLEGDGGPQTSPLIDNGRIVLRPTGTTLGSATALDTGSATKANTAPALACATNGACLVAWAEQHTDLDIYAVIVRPGQAPSAPFVISAATGNETAPAVASNGTNFLVGWERAGEIAVRTVNADTTLGTVQRLDTLSTNPANQDRRLALAWTATEYLAAWETRFAANDGDVLAARINASGVPVADSALTVVGGDTDQLAPQLAFDPANNRALVIFREGATLRGRLVGNGTLLSQPITVGSAASASALLAARLSADPANGGWVAAWATDTSDARVVRLQAIAPDGGLRAAPQTIGYQVRSANATVAPESIALACRAAGCALSAGQAPWDDPTIDRRLFLDQLTLVADTPPLGLVALNRATQITIDDDRPTSSITLPGTGGVVRAGSTTIIGGVANDPTSYIAQVELEVNGGAWQTASGAEQWSYALPVPSTEGTLIVRSRATDAVGNRQNPLGSSVLSIDGTPPQLNTFIAPNSFRAPSRLPDARWQLALDGSVFDLVAGVEKVEVLVLPNGDGWQTASLNGNNWTMNYQLARFGDDGQALERPTGVYTVYVRATDRVGNSTLPANYLNLPLQLDATPPTIILSNPFPGSQSNNGGTVNVNGATTIVTGTSVLSGTVSDPGMVGSGVQNLDVRLIPADLGVAPGQWLARYRNSASPTGVATLIRNDNDINFTWPNEPAVGVNANGFSVEWTRSTLFRVTGSYTFTVAPDLAGRMQVFLDGTSILDSASATSVVRNVSGGLHQLQVIYTAGNGTSVANFGVRLREAAWQPATLAASGNGVRTTNWSYAVPAGVEGVYQIDTRARDMVNNRAEDGETLNRWRGEIDTAGPRLRLDVEYLGIGPNARTVYRFWANDFNLTQTDLTSPCPVQPGDLAYYDTSWWSDWFQGANRLYQIASTCTVEGHALTLPVISARDIHGNRSTANATAPQPPNVRRLYWTNGSSVQRLDLNDANVLTIATGQPNATGITVDTNGSRIYWSRDEVINYAGLVSTDLDGGNLTNPRIVWFGSRFYPPSKVFMDGLNNSVYFTTPHTDTVGNLRLWRYVPGAPFVDSTGYGGFPGEPYAVTFNSNTGSVVTGYNSPNPYGLAWQQDSSFSFSPTPNERIFYPFIGETRIGDGTPPIGPISIIDALCNGTPCSNTHVYTYTTTLRDVEYDPVENNYYYVTGNNQVRRVLNKSQQQYLQENIGNPRRRGDGSNPNLMGVWNLPPDASAPIITPAQAGLTFQPRSIILDVPGRKIYIADPGNGRIWRANLDGSSLEVVLNTTNARYMALDVNVPPTSGDQTLTINQGAAVNVTLQGADLNRTALRYTITRSFANGTTTSFDQSRFYGAPPTLTYTPTLDFVGSDTLLYTVTDGRGAFATGSINIQVRPVSTIVVESTILSPVDGTTLTSLAPITVRGGALANAGLKTLTLTVNGAPVGIVDYSGGPAQTDANWALNWTPPAPGSFTLVATLTDRNDRVQTRLFPVTITVDDNTPPAVTLGTTVLTTSALLTPSVVELRGTANDASGIRGMAVRTGTADFAPAQLDAPPCSSCTWRAAWVLGGEPDNQIFSVTARATDLRGTTADVTANVTVDIRPPAEVTATLRYRAVGGALQPLLPGATLRDAANPAAPELLIDWTASSDAAGVAGYRVGWSDSPTTPLNALTFVAANAPRSQTQFGSEARVLYAHMVSLDANGNARRQVFGPIYVDAPTTPDLVAEPSYRDWQQSGAAQLSADSVASRRTVGVAQQQLFTSWNAAGLRLSWLGANWDQDGDLFIYLDTVSGGATTAFNPFGTAATLRLPAQDGDQLAADYLIQVTGQNNALLRNWNGSTWVEVATFATTGAFVSGGAPQLRSDTSASLTDLFVPFSALAIANPATTGLKMVAFATDEGALRLWAAAPDHNPLTSARALRPDLAPGLMADVTLTQQYSWANLGSGVRPAAGHFSGADLEAELRATPGAITVGYLSSNLYHLLTPGQPLDANLDGVPDVALLGAAPGTPVGAGAIVSYTITITNRGTGAADNVQLLLNARGGLNLSGPNTVTIGSVAPGARVTAVVTGTISAGTSSSAELNVAVADATYSRFEWLWALHPIDRTAPQAPTLRAPVGSAPAGLLTFVGQVDDPSGVPTITFEITDGGAPTTFTCSDATPEDGLFACPWDAGTIDRAVSVRVRASDRWGNLGPWSASTPLVIDTTPPTVALDAALDVTLRTGFIAPGQLTLNGQVNDNRAATGVLRCLADTTNCLRFNVTPVGQPVGSFTNELPITSSGDGVTTTLTLVGLDAAGNRSQPFERTLRIDSVAPQLSVVPLLNSISLSDYFALAEPLKGDSAPAPVLRGSANDGGIVAAVYVRIQDVNGNTFYQAATRDGNNWSFTPFFSEPGNYNLTAEAWDGAGNLTMSDSYPLVVRSEIDLQLSKRHTPEPIIAGQPVTYTLTITNPSKLLATSVRLTDTLPSGLTFRTATPGAPICEPNANRVICLLGNLAPRSSRVVTITANTSPALGVTTTNTAVVTSATMDPNPGNSNVSDLGTVQRIADLSINKVGPSEIRAGVLMSYTLTVRNAGPSTASSVVVSDTLPPIYISASWRCTAGSGAACAEELGGPNLNSGGSIPPGGVLTYTITMRPRFDATGIVTNTATVSAGAGATDPNSANNSSTVVAPLKTPTDLSIFKQITASDPFVGSGSVSYQIIASNASLGVARNVRVRDLFPANDLGNVTWTCSASGNVSCPAASGSGNIDWTIANFGNGLLNIRATAQILASATSPIYNTATITPGPNDVDARTDDDSATASLNVNRRTDLQISKQVDKLSVLPGEPLRYTVIITNSGPINLAAVRVVDNLPSGLDLTSIRWTCSASSGSSCETPSGTLLLDTNVALLANGTATFSIDATTRADASGTLTNSAEVFTPINTFDFNTTNNRAEVNTTVDTITPRTADLQISKRGPAVVGPDGPISYTLTVTNTGPLAVNDAVLDEFFPSEIGLASWECSASSGSFCSAPGTGSTSTNISLGVGGTATFTLTANVAETAVGPLVNRATITLPSGISDLNAADNTATITTTVSLAAQTRDVAVSMRANSASATPGFDASLTLTVTNTGNARLTAVNVADLLPPGATVTFWNCNTNGGALCEPSFGTTPLSATLDMPRNSQAEFQVNVRVPSDARGIFSYTASANFADTPTDPTPTNNTASASVALTPVTNLSVNKTASSNSLRVGDVLTYTVTVNNTGPSAAFGAVLSDTLPAGFNANWVCVVNGGGSCTASGSGNLSETLNLAVGASATFTITGGFINGGFFENRADVGPDPSATDQNSFDDSSSAYVNVQGVADIAVAQNWPSSAVPGTGVSGTLTITNRGPSAASNIPVQTNLPGLVGLNWVCSTTAGGSCAESSGNFGIASSVTLPSGGSATYTITGSINQYAVGTLTSELISPTSSWYDPDTNNNTSSVTITLTPRSDLAISLSGPPSTSPGATVNYTVVVSATGPSVLRDVPVRLVLPAAATATGWFCSASNSADCGSINSSGVLSTTLRELPPGGSVTIIAGATVDISATGSLSSTAEVDAPGGATDPVLVNNRATRSIPILEAVDLSVTKRIVNDRGGTLAPGEQAVYQIVVSNGGPNRARTASVIDNAPLALGNISWSCLPAAACPSPSGTSALSTTLDLLPNTSATLTLTGTIGLSASGTLTNSVRIAAGPNANDTSAGNDQAEARVTLVPAVNIVASLTPNSQLNTPGTPVTLTLQLRNDGPSNALGTVVRSADIPLALRNLTWSCAASGGATCATNNGTLPDTGSPRRLDTTVDLPPGGTVEYTINATSDAAAVGSVEVAASAVPTEVERNPINNQTTATIIFPGTIVGDLQVRKTGPVAAEAGSPVSYTILVTNTTNAALRGIRVQDIAPPELTISMWQCYTQRQGNNCGMGSGSLDTLINLDAGDAASFDISADINSSATGTVTNTAQITPPLSVRDTNPANNRSDSALQIGPTVSLTAYLSADRTSLNVNEDVVLTLEVSSNFFGNVDNASARLVFPAGLTPISWTCSGAGCRTASGTGTFSDTINITSSETIFIAVTARANGTVFGVLPVYGEVAPPAGYAEAFPHDNRMRQDVTVNLAATETPTPTATATATSTSTPTATATATNTSTPTATATATSTSTPTATATATSTSTPTATSTATTTATPSATPSATPMPTPPPATGSRIYVPIAQFIRNPFPDLVIEQLSVSQDQVAIVVSNQGNVMVDSPFWVDLYVAPQRVPSGPNQIWQMLGGQGAAWGVNGVVLRPGERIVLTLRDSFFQTDKSNLGNLLPGMIVYAQVDSASVGSVFGAINERDEQPGSGPYNNITMSTVGASQSSPAAPIQLPDVTPNPRIPLPQRPTR
jgi:uncharacterized repeat protein (TIGR01451 family)